MRRILIVMSMLLVVSCSSIQKDKPVVTETSEQKIIENKKNNLKPSSVEIGKVAKIVPVKNNNKKDSLKASLNLNLNDKKSYEEIVVTKENVADNLVKVSDIKKQLPVDDENVNLQSLSDDEYEYVYEEYEVEIDDPEATSTHISGTVTKPKKKKIKKIRKVRRKKKKKAVLKNEDSNLITDPNLKKIVKKVTDITVDSSLNLNNGEVVVIPNVKIAGQDQTVPTRLEDGDAKFVIFNFNKAELTDVIVTVADLLKLNYIIDPAVKGRITIHTSEKIAIEDAFPIFQQILAINGVALIKSGRLYKFMPTKDLLREPIETYIGRDSSTIPFEDKMIFQIIPLNYIPATTLQGLLSTIMTKNGMFLEVPGLNRLYIIETATNIKRMLDIINTMDVNIFDQIQLKLYEIKHAEPNVLIMDIEQIFQSMGYGSEMQQTLRFIELPRLKSILVISAFPKLFPTMDYWIKKLDVSTQNIQVKLIPVKYIGGKNINKLISEIKTIFSALGYGKSKGKKSGSKDGHVLEFINISRLNSILVITSYPDLFPKLMEWMERLDQPLVGEDAMKVYVYYVQHSDASNLSSILNQLFSKKWAKNTKNVDAAKEKKDTKDITINIKQDYKFDDNKISNKSGDTKGGKNGKKRVSVASKSDASTPAIEVASKNGEILTLDSEFEGEVNIISDDSTNSLIIRTNPRNYPVILDTLMKLDIMPLQVLIEVIIAELQLDNSTKYGLEWAMKETGSTNYGFSSTGVGNILNPLKAGAVLGATGLQGLSFFVSKSDELLGLVQAYARESKLEILSSPMLLTSENKPASISIVNQIPIESTTVDPASNTTRTSIQFKDVGIKLDVIPKISKNGYVNLDISQEVSQVSDIQTASSTPAIFSRQTKTNVVVKNKQTLVIAGLMEKRSSSSAGGIPGIFKLPFIGCLFGNKSDSSFKTELLIFITPHVISGSVEAKSKTQEFRKRLKSVNELIKKGF